MMTSIFKNNLMKGNSEEQGFRRSVYWDKYRWEIATQLKNSNLDDMIHPLFRNINRLFVSPFKNGRNDPTRDSFEFLHYVF